MVDESGGKVVLEMERNQSQSQSEDMEIEVLPSMWPEDIESEKPYNVEKPGGDGDMLQEVNILEEPTIVDLHRVKELTDYTDWGSSQLSSLVKNWEYQQANAARLLKEELDILSKQKEEVELKQLEILEDFRFEDSYGGDKRPISILDDVIDFYRDVPRRKNDVVVRSKSQEIDVEYGTVAFWKQRALHLEKLLEESLQRELVLTEKLQDSIKNLERLSSPIDEMSQMLKRADTFLHFIVQHSPVVMGHQDKDLRYRFIYNHFPSLQEKDIIGKRDVEIFSGVGVKESEDFKREVMERGLPSKREITFDTELFGLKTFLIYVAPVFSKSGETIGINYMGMEITDQVKKRERMFKLREEIAVQKAKETELNKTIHITEETMRAKQMLATMSHEIRSPLSGVVSVAEILSNTNLDRDQRQLLNVMMSSGDLVLQLINDILDLSKVESGAMKLEATKFRPREVVKHVLQTAAASLQKVIILEGHIADNVPIEVTGDVLRIRQILTNLISNAIKFTHEGKVGINLYVVPDTRCGNAGAHDLLAADPCPMDHPKEKKHSSASLSVSDQKESHYKNHGEVAHSNYSATDEPGTPVTNGSKIDGDKLEEHQLPEKTVWLRCDVHDTGIGIPENAIPTLFKKYMQASATHARKYGGTGLGLAICKQLVELMGGHLTVSSQVNHGSTFTFVLPYKLSTKYDSCDDPDELSEMEDHDAVTEDETIGFFQFQPRTLGSPFPSNGSSRTQRVISYNISFADSSNYINELPGDSFSFPSGDGRPKETTSVEDACSEIEVGDTLSEHESSFSHSPEFENDTSISKSKHCRENTNRGLQNPAKDSTRLTEPSREVFVRAKAVELQKISQSEEKPEKNFPSTSGSNPHEQELKLKPKILLVEDNKINVIVTQSMMKQLGHTLDVVNNGVEAVRAVQGCHYDLILMDVCMPIMDGLQATRLIRSFEETGNWDAALKAGIEQCKPKSSAPQDYLRPMPPAQRVPIIAMTANALSESAEECYANGMDSFVSKPVTFQKLKECLEQYLPRYLL